MFDVVNLCLRGSQNVLLAFRNGEVFHADGHARAGGEFVTHVLQTVAQNDRGLDAAVAVGRAHKAGNVLLGQHAVDLIKAQLFGQNVAHQHAAGGGVVHHAVGHAHLDAGVQRNLPAVVSGFHFPRGAEGHALAQLKAALGGHVVQTKHDILRRHDDRAAVGGRENVVGAHHEHAAFDLRFHRQRNVHGHLVTVKVGVVGRADERVQTDGLAFDQQGFKSLDAQTVQGRGAVQQNGVLAHHF